MRHLSFRHDIYNAKETYIKVLKVFGAFTDPWYIICKLIRSQIQYDACICNQILLKQNILSSMCNVFASVQFQKATLCNISSFYSFLHSNIYQM